MDALFERKIGIAADRRSDAIAALVHNMGGHPFPFPLQGKQQLNDEAAITHVEKYLASPFSWVILTTGIGARTLAGAAEGNGLIAPFLHKIHSESLAIRGSKTMDWVKEKGLYPQITAEDGTMESLLNDIPEADPKENSSVLLQTYNEDEKRLIHVLETKGYAVYKANPYTFLPPDPFTIQELSLKTMEGKLDAVVFTSKTQVKNLLEENERSLEVIAAFNRHVQAVAVGKVTARALHSYGIEKVVQPKRPKIGAMVVELGRFFQQEGLRKGGVSYEA